MTIALLLIGVLLIVSAVKGTEHELATRVASDMTGQDGFLIWIAAIFALYLVSKIPGLAQPVKWLTALIVVVIFLNNTGVVNQFITALETADATGPAPAVPLQTGSSSSSSQSGAGGSTGGGSETSELSTVAELAAFA
jgi:uncharacterized membrane protein YgcG